MFKLHSCRLFGTRVPSSVQNITEVYTYIYIGKIYRYNLRVSYKPNEGRYLQLMSAEDLYIQNITVLEHDNHNDSFQVKLRNVSTNYPLGAVRVEDQRFID